MAAALYSTVSGLAAVPSTLMPTSARTELIAVGGRDEIDGAVLGEGVSASKIPSTTVQAAWITIIERQTETLPSTTENSLLVPTLSGLQRPSFIIVGPGLDAPLQAGVDFPWGDPAVECPTNTAPLGQQLSSYMECQKTIAPGEICCIPFIPEPSKPPNPPGTSAPTNPASTPASPTSDSSSSSTPPASSLITSTSTPTSPPASPSSSLLSFSSSSSSPASATTIPAPAPMPTVLTPPKSKTPILPILIPCALAAVGIVAFAIWWTMWRSRGPRHRPPPAINMEPKVADGKKIFGAGNFSVAMAFERGIEEMGKKEKVGGEGKRGWKGGYRKYRESGAPGSGLLGEKSV